MKVVVFKDVAIGHQFVLRDAIVGSVRFISKPVRGGSFGYHGKKNIVKVSLKLPMEDPHKPKAWSPMTEGSSITTQEHDDNPLMGYEGISTRQPRQPHVHFMHKWALTTKTEDELEPLTIAQALGSAHWREAMKREHKFLIHNRTWELVSLPPNKIIVSDKWCY